MGWKTRSIVIVTYLAFAYSAAWFFTSQATTTVIIVRHAETNPAGTQTDPELSSLGQARAVHLADFIQSIDVTGSVNAIFATESISTQQTASPLAYRVELDVEAVDQSDPDEFTDMILREHKGEVVLVVTQGDSMAPLIESLHGSKNVVETGPDHLYIVTVPWGEGGKVKTLMLPYGLSWSRPQQ